MVADADELARLTFLRALVDALGPTWVSGYAEVKPFGVTGMTLRREGTDGFVTVVPTLISGRAMSWRPFVGNGHPHYDLKPDGQGNVRAHTLADAVTALERWVKTKQPIVRSPAQPMLPLIRPLLEAMASGPTPAFADAIDRTTWSLTSEGDTQLDAARAAIDVPTLVRSFPREDNGKLLADDVLLARIASTKTLKPGRDVYLVARGARPRSGLATITLTLADVIDSNESHVWAQAPWLWQAGIARPSLDAKATEYIALVDDGRFDDALALYGMALGPRVIKLLEGVDGMTATHGDAHRATVRRALWSAAPWKLTTQGGLLALLPHQTGQVKTWLAWRPPSMIELDNTASNMRLAHARWKRDVSEDQERLGIGRATEEPKVVAAKTRAKPAKPPKPLLEMIVGKDIWSATTALKHAKDRPDAVDELLAIVASDTADRTTRANAMWIISEIAQPADAPRVMPYLDDREPLVQRKAIDTVKRTGYQEAVPALARLVCLRDERKAPSVSDHAATALKILGGSPGPRGFERYFASPDPRQREAACHGFMIFQGGEKLAKPLLEGLLNDADPVVARVAKEALEVVSKRG